MKKNSPRGISLMECLIGLSLSLIVILMALGFFNAARTLFFKLKEAEEEDLAAMAAVDKMRVDSLQAGRGLLDPMELELMDGLSVEGGELTIFSVEKRLELVEDPVPGQTRISFTPAEGLNKGKSICFFSKGYGEVTSIASSEQSSVILSGPLIHSYTRGLCEAVLLERVRIFLDLKTGIIRRAVNAASAQPLLENVRSMSLDFDKTVNLLRLEIISDSKMEKKYEFSVFPKNTALSTRN